MNIFTVTTLLTHINLLWQMPVAGHDVRLYAWGKLSQGNLLLNYYVNRVLLCLSLYPTHLSSAWRVTQSMQTKTSNGKNILHAEYEHMQ